MTSPYATPEVELQDMRTQLGVNEALLVAAKNAHAVLDILLSAAYPNAALPVLIERYGFTHRQALAVIDAQMRDLTRSELDIAEQRCRRLGRSIAARANEGAHLADGAANSGATSSYVRMEPVAGVAQAQPKRRSIFVEWAPRPAHGIEELQVGQVGTVSTWDEYYVSVVWAGLEDQMVTTGMVFDEEDLREIDVHTFASRVLA